MATKGLCAFCMGMMSACQSLRSFRQCHIRRLTDTSTPAVSSVWESTNKVNCRNNCYLLWIILPLSLHRHVWGWCYKTCGEHKLLCLKIWIHLLASVRISTTNVVDICGVLTPDRKCHPPAIRGGSDLDLPIWLTAYWSGTAWKILQLILVDAGFSHFLKKSLTRLDLPKILFVHWKVCKQLLARIVDFRMEWHTPL